MVLLDTGTPGTSRETIYTDSHLYGTAGLGTAHYLLRVQGWEYLQKLSIKSLPCLKNMTKESLPCIQLLQNKFVSRMLRKFLYLSGIVLLLFETLNFQKEINNKRHTSFNKQSY